MAQFILVLRVKYPAGIAVDHDFGKARTSALSRVFVTPGRIFMMPAMENDAEVRVARKMSKMPEVMAMVGFGRTAERWEQRGHETCQDQRTPTPRKATPEHHAPIPLSRIIKYLGGTSPRRRR
jgi:hypothetical protein